MANFKIISWNLSYSEDTMYRFDSAYEKIWRFLFYSPKQIF